MVGFVLMVHCIHLALGCPGHTVTVGIISKASVSGTILYLNLTGDNSVGVNF